METYKMMVTPDVAEKLLESVPEYQRRKSAAYVDLYTREMQEGRWNEILGGRIVLGKNGELMDGQHRMQAIVNSGKSYMFDVISGVEESEFSKIDQGKPRSVNDFATKIYSNANRMTAIAKALLSMSSKSCFSNVIKRTSKYSSGAILEFIEKNIDEVTEYARGLNSLCKKSGKQRASEYTIVRKLCENKYGEDAKDFFNTISGDNSFDDKYCARAIAKIAKIEKMYEYDMASILLTACEAFVMNKGVNAITIDKRAINRLQCMYDEYCENQE